MWKSLLAAIVKLLGALDRHWPELMAYFVGKKVQEGEQVRNTLEAVAEAQAARESVRNDTTFNRLRRAQAAGRLRGFSAIEHESE